MSLTSVRICPRSAVTVSLLSTTRLGLVRRRGEAPVSVVCLDGGLRLCVVRGRRLPDGQAHGRMTLDELFISVPSLCEISFVVVPKYVKIQAL